MTGAPADGVPVLEFAAGLPGFPGPRRFVLTAWGDGDEDSPFALLRGVDGDDVRFLVVWPGAFFPHYAPEVDDDTAARLGLVSGDDAVVLAIVNVPAGPESAVANLLAPIVVNPRTRRAEQAVLVGSAHRLREPLVAAGATVP